MGGGPGTGIYRSQDGGESWEQLKNGLPKSNMGKIGLAMAPQDPNILYAAIELDRRKGGVYRSENRGSSWQKMSDAVAGGTGPHYYQELFASPHQLGELYLADNYMQVSFDGGKTFSRMNEKEKHVDNHAVVFKKNDPNYILVGCDGGLYESFDKTKNWKFIDNLPVTQFYKIAVDDDQPFYNVYGGTQDNNTQGAPSRTDNLHGIRNSDWFVVLGGDGHQPATEPGNPNIVYAQWQQGNLNRYDRATGENVNIKPQPELGEKTDRFNWDAPILVSPHNPKRVYFASQRVWKSEDRGDSWQPISKDLTKNVERVTTPFFGKQQKWDNPWDVYAMSNYSTVTSLSESPLKEGLIYAGTDDGVIQVTEDGGNTWRLVDFKKIKGLPATAFVNDIKADLYDENIVYAVFDNHKFGDYNPYLFKSTDKGLTWVSISNNLPKRTLLWRIVQDHVNKDLMFVGTEFGLYFTNDGGKRWSQLKGGLPNISVRDIAIQKRENDLVLGTFGRGIYILDDYSSLREFSASTKDEARLFTPRDGYWYIQKRTLGGSRKAAQGDNFFVADNPAFGVEFTFYLKDKYKSREAQRKEKEKKMEKANQTVAVPKWSILEEENKEIKPKVWIFIYGEDGEITKKIAAGNKKGFNRISWNLTNESVRMVTPDNVDHKPSGYLVSPGEYSAELFKQVEGKYLSISDKVSFNVVQLNKGHLTGSSSTELASFWEEVVQLRANTVALSAEINDLKKAVDVMLKAYERAEKLDEALHNELLTARSGILDLKQQLNGSKPRSEIGEKNEFPTIWTYLGNAGSGISRSTYGPTATHKKSLKSAQSIYDDVNGKLSPIKSAMEAMAEKLKETGAPEIKK